MDCFVVSLLAMTGQEFVAHFTTLICPSCQSVAVGVIDLTPKSPASFRASRPTEGRLAIVTNAGRDAVDADALLTNGA
jgi:hypothetical protein